MLADVRPNTKNIVRTAISTALLVAAMSIIFVPWDGGTSGIILLAGLLTSSMLIQPPRAQSPDAQSNERILWSERDIGQRFSIVMFQSLMWIAVAVLAWFISTEIGGLLGLSIAMGIIAISSWVILRNWKNRNAR
ncbi:hypothetical protein N9D37_01185 [Erythrobacter sp.]|nr:hypothetical protein [Erythrobacter sp.]